MATEQGFSVLRVITAPWLISQVVIRVS